VLTYNQLVEIIIDSSATKTEGIERGLETRIREVLFRDSPIKVITGMRRSGKSFILKRLYKTLITSKIPIENILFLNFEDDRLSPNLSVKKLREIYNLFMAHTKKEQAVYLFLDEIQNVPNWESFVRTIYDSSSIHIYLTGSNSRLLSRDLAGTLGGRLLEYTLFPLSFTETLQLQKIPYKTAFERAKHKAEIKQALSSYLENGGLPEIFQLPDSSKKTYRKSLIDKIIIRDISLHYRLESTELLQNILYFLEKNTAHIISYRRIANAAKSNENTVEKYISYLENAFIIAKLKKFSWKTKIIFDSTKKFFFIDNLFCKFADVEDRLENTCYLHLLRKYGQQNIYLGRDERAKEIDFVVKKADSSLLAIQVCYQLNDDNWKREISSLKLLKKYSPFQTNEYQIVIMQNTSTKTIPENFQIIHLLDFLMES